MQPRRPILINTLHLRHQQIPLGEKRPDRQFVRAGALAEDPTGEVYGGEGEVGEQGGGEIDFPAFGLDFGYAADY